MNCFCALASARPAVELRGGIHCRWVHVPVVRTQALG
jgi:hypothetical protein